jgi:soluble lytic murein transglycosylase-like protein
MRRSGPRGIRLALAGLAFALAAQATPARADDDLRMRLAALRALSEPADTDARPSGATARVPARTRRAIRDAALRYRLDPRLLRAVIRHESAWDPRAVSTAGARGLMQLMPATARELGVIRPFDPRENVLGGARYLRRLFDRLGSWPRALAAYHAGPGNVIRGAVGPATQRYVARVLASWRDAGSPSP